MGEVEGRVRTSPIDPLASQFGPLPPYRGKTEWRYVSSTGIP